MKIEIEVTPEIHADLMKALRSYRAEPAPGDTSTPELLALAVREERTLAALCLAQLFRILQRGEPLTVDCEILEAAARLQQTIAGILPK